MAVSWSENRADLKIWRKLTYETTKQVWRSNNNAGSFLNKLATFWRGVKGQTILTCYFTLCVPQKIIKFWNAAYIGELIFCESFFQMGVAVPYQVQLSTNWSYLWC